MKGVPNTHTLSAPKYLIAKPHMPRAKVARGELFKVKVEENNLCTNEALKVP